MRLSRFRYIAFHKPYGVLSQFTGEPGQRTLAEFNLPPGVYAAGRLDKDSEGLLILSDDGPFIKRLLDPDHGHARSYLIQVEGSPKDRRSQAFTRRCCYQRLPHEALRGRAFAGVAGCRRTCSADPRS